MNYNIIEEENKIILENIESFDPQHIFECGQAFRWHLEEDNSYTIVHNGKILNVAKKGLNVILKGSNLEEFYNTWVDYFDLETDYSYIKEKLSEDPILKKAIEFGSGIRIINQDPYETTISFIISANNQIGRIKNSIRLISELYGKKIGEFNGREYYTFPRPEKLAQASVEELQEKTRVGFRAKYIVNTSRIIEENKLDLKNLMGLDKEGAEEELQKFPGVGPKVSSCISLFSLKKKESFPVDVWVKRVMEHFYFKEDTKNAEISSFAKEKFGELGGYAQQYLFYYARELGIGK